MWVKRADWAVLQAENSRLRAHLTTIEDSLERTRRSARAEIQAADKRAADFAEKLLDAARKPPIVVPPPDTAGIIRETIEGLATVLNGWRSNEVSQAQTVAPLSMEDQGLDATAGLRDRDITDFVPPWERVPDTPPPSHGGWIGAEQGYTPYVPGAGNSVQPAGGVE